MKVTEIYEYLKHGEVGNLPLSDITIEGNEGKFISYLNRAMFEINKEFALVQNEETIALKTGVTKYFIKSQTIVRVLAAYDELGNPLGINNEDEPLMSVFTPSLSSIEFFGTEQTSISLILLENLAKIKEMDGIVNISEVFLQPLLTYIRYLAHLGVGTEIAEVQAILQEYLASVNIIKTSGTFHVSNYTNEKLEMRGFV